jgi:hypothetical protein
LVATDPAFDALARETGLVDDGARCPGCLPFGSYQGLWRAGGSTVTAEGAFARCKINRRVAGVVRDDVRWTGAYTITAACARLQEIDFGKGPWRAERALTKREVAAQEVAAASRFSHEAYAIEAQ